MRSEQSLIQTIGRAARHINGTAILYADKETKSIRRAIDETDRRRKTQLAFNKKHGINPAGVQKEVRDIIHIGEELEDGGRRRGKKPRDGDLEKELARLDKKMRKLSRDLEFERAAEVRDDIRMLKKQMLGVEAAR